MMLGMLLLKSCLIVYRIQNSRWALVVRLGIIWAGNLPGNLFVYVLGAPQRRPTCCMSIMLALQCRVCYLAAALSILLYIHICTITLSFSTYTVRHQTNRDLAATLREWALLMSSFAPPN